MVNPFVSEYWTPINPVLILDLIIWFDSQCCLWQGFAKALTRNCQIRSRWVLLVSVHSTPLKRRNFMFVTPCLQEEVYNLISIHEHYLSKSKIHKKMHLSGKQCNLEINPEIRCWRLEGSKACKSCNSYFDLELRVLAYIAVFKNFMPAIECSKSRFRSSGLKIPAGWISLQKELFSTEWQSLPAGW